MSPRSRMNSNWRAEPPRGESSADCHVLLRMQARHRRSARAAIIVVAIVVALVGGGIGGYALSQRFATGSSTSGLAPGADEGVADSEQWYTCGMHPNVLQKGPGECPICHMKLTPLKKEDDGGGAAAGVSKERKVLYWRAPMDPNYISDKPGKSPMGMDLVPVYAGEEESASAHTIRIDPVTTQNMGIRTTTVRRGPLIKTIRTVGRVDYDEQLVTFVDTKFSGWIEKLDVDETGQHVDKGQLLFSVYSPELYAAQQEYLSAVQNLPRLEASTFAPAREEAAKLVEAAVTKLKYFDVSDEQIETLRETETIEKSLAIHSPATGIVTEKMALEGMYVKPGMRLYTIADLSRVWVYVDVYEYQLPWIRVGQRATMTLPYIPGERFEGQVVYIYPYLEQQTRVIKVRMEFENPALALKPGMYANVKLESELQRDALLIPRESYIDSGTRQVVFVDRGEGKFAPRDIQVGVEAEDGMVEVLYGLDEGEVIVTSGQFMLDAESKLKEAVAKMMEAERAKTTKRAPATERQEAHGAGMHMDHSGESMPADAAYACPMEHHPDETDPANQGPYFSATAGTCPRCGMKLKPIAELPWTATYQGGAGTEDTAAQSSGDGIPPEAKYACPMETHPDESDPKNQGAYFSDEPGRCPRCGMELKPLDKLDWVRTRRAAGGGDVAYTCPDHQHVFSKTAGECPRCGRKLEPFKVMYTCPNPEHGDVVSSVAGNCPRCGRGLAAFRSVWLSEEMAGANVPPHTGPADEAQYRCPTHPLVHSNKPGYCTICGAAMRPEGQTSESVTPKSIPPGATYTCPMQECWHFSSGPGECPKCGMRLKPIESVAWAKELLDLAGRESADAYLCPMHPEKRSNEPGTCPTCGMQLVTESSFHLPHDAPSKIAAQVNYITEHYLELQRLLASDKTADVARQALAVVSASEELLRHVDDPAVGLGADLKSAVNKLRAAALKITGSSLEKDRVTFVDLSAAMRTLVNLARPDRLRWPKLYIFHCPMSKGDWVQTGAEKANPYYGFKMLNCGELREVK